MATRPESVFQSAVRNASELWSDRIETTGYGADPGRPDTDFYVDGRLLPIEFKIGSVAKDGILLATIRPAQRIWFMRAFKLGVAAGVVIGEKKAKQFWLVRADQVEYLYLKVLKATEAKTVQLERMNIQLAFRDLLYGKDAPTSQSIADRAKSCVIKRTTTFSCEYGETGTG